MPISQKVKFVCKRCGFSKSYTIGDCLSANDIVKKCPICKGIMLRSTEAEKSENSLFGKVCDILFKNR